LARDYELVLMLDPAAPDGRRDEVAGETRKRIESGGELKQADTWGTRKLAFEIRQRTEADYRFYRFEANNDLLEQLDHTLKITDGVLRFRIFKVDVRTPTMAPPPTAQPAGVSARAAKAEARRGKGPAETAAEEPSAEAPAPAEPAEADEPAEAADSAEQQPAAEDALGGEEGTGDEAAGGEGAGDEGAGDETVGGEGAGDETSGAADEHA
jgi:small subunit ribosomal protein S6